MLFTNVFNPRIALYIFMTYVIFLYFIIYICICGETRNTSLPKERFRSARPKSLNITLFFFNAKIAVNERNEVPEFPKNTVTFFLRNSAVSIP